MPPYRLSAHSIYIIPIIGRYINDAAASMAFGSLRNLSTEEGPQAEAHCTLDGEGGRVLTFILHRTEIKSCAKRTRMGLN